jgi:hypothetical protein
MKFIRGILLIVLVTLFVMAPNISMARVEKGDKIVNFGGMGYIGKESKSVMLFGSLGRMFRSYLQVGSGLNISITYTKGSGSSGTVGLNPFCKYFFNPDDPKLNFYVGGSLYLMAMRQGDEGILFGGIGLVAGTYIFITKYANIFFDNYIYGMYAEGGGFSVIDMPIIGIGTTF